MERNVINIAEYNPANLHGSLSLYHYNDKGDFIFDRKDIFGEKIISGLVEIGQTGFYTRYRYHDLAVIEFSLALNHYPATILRIPIFDKKNSGEDKVYDISHIDNDIQTAIVIAERRKYIYSPYITKDITATIKRAVLTAYMLIENAITDNKCSEDVCGSLSTNKGLTAVLSFLEKGCSSSKMVEFNGIDELIASLYNDGADGTPIYDALYLYMNCENARISFYYSGEYIGLVELFSSTNSKDSQILSISSRASLLFAGDDVFSYSYAGVKEDCLRTVKSEIMKTAKEYEKELSTYVIAESTKKAICDRDINIERFITAIRSEYSYSHMHANGIMEGEYDE